MSKRVDLDMGALLDTLADKVADRIRGTGEPRWRTVASEALRRGFPTARALRDWCKGNGVPVKGRGKTQVVDMVALDSAPDRLPERKERGTRNAAADDASILAAAGLRVSREPGKKKKE